MRPNPKRWHFMSLLLSLLTFIACSSPERAQPSVTGNVREGWGLIMTPEFAITGVGFTLEEHPDMNFLLYFSDIEELQISSPAGFDGPSVFEDFVLGKTVEVIYMETETGELIVTSLAHVDP
jgi:hypothetical protein